MPASEAQVLDAELTGLDALDMATVARPESVAVRVWRATWPKVAAVAIVLGLWQLVVWSGWRPTFVLPPPADVLARLFTGFSDDRFLESVAVTMRRGAVGFGIALVLGTVLGLAVSQSRLLRAAVGSMVTGLQTMPSIAWFPLAVLLFRRSEGAILFVVVLGAAPAIANGLIAGVDHIPPVLLRAGRMLGARGLSSFRHVVFPAAVPSYVAGLKQGWAFAWRSLLAGELLVQIGTSPSLGVRLSYARELSDAELLMALMLVVLAIGVLIDVTFGVLERSIRRRRGLLDQATV